MATLVMVKLDDQNCRAVVATNFNRSFCASSLVKTLGLKVTNLAKPPEVKTSDGTPIEILGEAGVKMELGPWQSAGKYPILVALDCPADLLIGDDLIKEIGKRFAVRFEYHKKSVSIGGTRVSMLDPLTAEEKFMK